MEICKKSKKKRKNIHRVQDLTPSDAPGPGSENRRAIFFREAKPPAGKPTHSKVLRIIRVGL